MGSFLAISWIVRFVFDSCGPPWFINISIDAVILRVVAFRRVRHLQLIRLVFVLLDLSSVCRKSIVMKRPLQNPNVNVHAFLFLRATERPCQRNRGNQVQQLNKQPGNVLFRIKSDRFHRSQHDVRQFIKHGTELGPGPSSGQYVLL